MVGPGPNTMRPGDTVFVIQGAKVPLILRVAGNGQYRIVGQAYVQGSKDGEVIDRNPNVETLITD